MTFVFPEPSKDDSIMELHHHKNNVDAYEEDGGLVNHPMLKHWFVLNVCDVLLGEDAMYRFSPRELFEKLEEYSSDSQAWQDMLEDHECKVELDDMEYQRQCAH